MDESFLHICNQSNLSCRWNLVVILKLKEQNDIPLGMLIRPDDFFGNLLNEGVDTTLKNFGEPAKDEEQFSDMMKACLEGIIEVLVQRQYKKYFECDITEQLRKETESARSHNIDAKKLWECIVQTRKNHQMLLYVISPAK